MIKNTKCMHIHIVLEVLKQKVTPPPWTHSEKGFVLDCIGGIANRIKHRLNSLCSRLCICTVENNTP
jgi:hypothetical protein